MASLWRAAVHTGVKEDGEVHRPYSSTTIDTVTSECRSLSMGASRQLLGFVPRSFGLTRDEDRIVACVIAR